MPSGSSVQLPTHPSSISKQEFKIIFCSQEYTLFLLTHKVLNFGLRFVLLLIFGSKRSCPQTNHFKRSYYTATVKTRTRIFVPICWCLYQIMPAMKCFQFRRGQRKDEHKTMRLNSGYSSFSAFTDQELKQSGPEMISHSASETSSDSRGRNQFPAHFERAGNLRAFTFSELKAATKNFSRSAKLGEGGFGCVYKGVIKSPDNSSIKIDVAVKQLNRRGQQGHKEWVTEVNVLGIVEHSNLVKLVGYCAEDGERGIQRLLVYEYMPNRSVEDHLSARSESTFSWDTRLKIAQDAARGLTYLHEEMEFQIIFRDLKSSNILLDEQWNGRLSDFGLAKLGPQEGLTHVSTAVVGTTGYTAPEYMQTGHLTSKSDVWSYGVFLYELITGRRPVDRNRLR
ncbi:hypothetical protein Leryth_009699 [Lithospermum erythrorhizon]|nr:hypothetical protein Leryth_009699 [Lithospermum erythrorhizon]